MPLMPTRGQNHDSCSCVNLTSNPCTIHALLMVPLDTLAVTYSGTYDAQPLSNAYKNWIFHF
jgi:hypothetical protein